MRFYILNTNKPPQKLKKDGTDIGGACVYFYPKIIHVWGIFLERVYFICKNDVGKGCDNDTKKHLLPVKQ